MASSPVPTPTENKPKLFEPRSIVFPEDVQEAIDKRLHTHIESRIKRLKVLHTSKVPEWRRIIAGTPREENKSFPFPNCSNVVHPVVGEEVDEIAAIVVELIWMTAPLVYYRYPATKDDKEGAENSDKARALQSFIDEAAFDPKELNLKPRHNEWLTDAAGLGKAYVCVAPEERMEMVYTGYYEKSSASKKDEIEFESKLLFRGPKVINLRYEDILPDPNINVFEDNDPIIRRCTLTKDKLHERGFKGHFKKEQVKKILGHPDNYGGDENKKRENQKKGISDNFDETVALWEIYECYFSWWHNDQKFRLIAWHHQKTNTTLNCVYNFVPQNQVPIIETRLTPDGTGYAQMLKYAQDEISTAKNQRADAITFGMLGINTVDPQITTIDRNFTMWPGIFLPVAKDAFQHYEVANPAFAGLSLENEQAMIQMAKSRGGVDPPVNAMGAGGTNKKGQYGGAMGTLAVMQASNSRNAHKTSSFRHDSVRLFSMITDFYGFLGVGDGLVKEALQDYMDRKMRIPIRAADASMNKEITKQNEIILNQAVQAYVKQISSMWQASTNPSADPAYPVWIKKIIVSLTRLMQQTIKDFQITDNPTEFIPDIEFPKEQQNGQAQPGQPNAAPTAPGLQNLVQLVQRGGAPPSNAGQPGMGGVLPGLAGVRGEP